MTYDLDACLKTMLGSTRPYTSLLLSRLDIVHEPFVLNLMCYLHVLFYSCSICFPSGSFTSRVRTPID